MTASVLCFGALALEVSASPDGEAGDVVTFPAGRPVLAREEGVALMEGVSRDLLRLLPDVASMDLGVALATFDSAELLRPGWPVHAALGELLQAAPGREGPRMASFFAHEGKMPSPGLQPEVALQGGPMRLLPFVLAGDEALASRVGRQMESVLMEQGMASAETALAAQAAFALPLEHARYVSVHDLCAMTAMQYQHGGLAGLWQIIEAALLAPESDEVFEDADEPIALYSEGQAVLALREYPWWKAAQPQPDRASERHYQALQRRLRQWEAVLGAHAIPVRTLSLRDEVDVLQAARRH
ncbi:MAG: hypothetical protein R3F04_01295 [Lysobacteraceae bacterium]